VIWSSGLHLVVEPPGAVVELVSRSATCGVSSCCHTLSPSCANVFEGSTVRRTVPSGPRNLRSMMYALSYVIYEVVQMTDKRFLVPSKIVSTLRPSLWKDDKIVMATG
jgi:hypothetical protein